MLNLDSANSVGDADELETPPTLPRPLPQPDEESTQLLAKQSERPNVTIKPPYTAPLAPFDMELVKRAGLEGKLLPEQSIWGGVMKQDHDSNAEATARFVDLERSGNVGKARKSSTESLSLHEKRARFAER